MNNLYAGFARVNVTPMMGIPVAGYFKERYAEGVLDDLELNAVALACGEEKVVLLALDDCGPDLETATYFREHVAEVTGLPMEAVFLHGTHTHTGPYVDLYVEHELVKEHRKFLYRKMADVAMMALADLKPAKMGFGIGQAPGVAFVRRYRMKDGSIKTNPGVNNPDIVAPIGEIDERVNVLRFDREGAETIVLANFGCHPDVVGGSKISGDWPAMMRRTLEQTIDNTKCIFFNGAEGDINHVNVHPKGGDFNGMFDDFDGCSRGYAHAQYMGRVVAGGVLQAYDKVQYVDVDTIRFKKRMINLPSNMPNPEDMPEAYHIEELHRAGKDDEIPYEGMMLTTVVAEAERMIKLEHGPAFFDMNLNAVAIGNVALIAIPGEPFNGIGRGLKEAEGWDLVLPCCLTNGCQGYYPMKECFDEGGYEARSSEFKAGVAEIIIDEGKALMAELRKKDL